MKILHVSHKLKLDEIIYYFKLDYKNTVNYNN